MINSAEEFIQLRDENNERANSDTADIATWNEVIIKYPDYKVWVIHNKTIQLEILEYLATDNDPEVREAVARKRKINDVIFNFLRNDFDEGVRFALITNTKLSPDKLVQINTDNSTWLKEQLNQRLKRKNE